MEKDALMALVSGRWPARIAYTGVKIGVFDAMRQEGKDAALIAQELGLDPALSYRLLRALASLGLLREDPARRFSCTPAGEFFRADHPETLRGIMLLEEGPEHYAIWKHLPDMIRDGRQNAFVREYGHNAFEHAAQNSEYAQVFDEAMSSLSSTETVWVLDALSNEDLSNVNRFCDVGGGHGHLLSTLLLKYEHMSGTVLERADVIRDESSLCASKMKVADRCRYVAGDMFAVVPSAGAYLFKHIIHDWNDEECVKILSNARHAAPADARLYIAEYVVPGAETSHFAKLFDIHMMCWGTGRERTSEEYAALMNDAGWKYLTTLFPSVGTIGVVAGIKA